MRSESPSPEDSLYSIAGQDGDYTPLLPREKRLNLSGGPTPSGLEPLGVPRHEKRFLFQRGKAYDPNAIATQV